MRRRRMAQIGLAATVLVGGTAGVAAATGNTNVRHYEAELRDVEGNDVGTVEFRVRRDGYTRVRFDVEAPGSLTPGFHGMHLHEVGVCDPEADSPDGATNFGSVGPHISLPGQIHGEHLGDLPPVLVNPDGTAEGSVVDAKLDVGRIFDANGAAVIIHANRDNQANIPSRYTSSRSGAPGPDDLTQRTGDNGNHLICGVLEK